MEFLSSSSTPTTTAKNVSPSISVSSDPSTSSSLFFPCSHLGSSSPSSLSTPPPFFNPNDPHDGQHPSSPSISPTPLSYNVISITPKASSSSSPPSRRPKAVTTGPSIGGTATMVLQILGLVLLHASGAAAAPVDINNGTRTGSGATPASSSPPSSASGMMGTSNINPADVSTITGFPALAQAIQKMPLTVRWSQSVLIEQILSNIPFVALGLLGIGFSTVWISLGKLNRPMFDLMLSTILVLLGSVLDLINLLICAFKTGNWLEDGDVRSMPLAIATQVLFGAATGARLFYLYRRSMQPHLNEVPVAMERSGLFGSRGRGISSASFSSPEEGGVTGTTKKGDNSDGAKEVLESGWAKRFSFRPRTGKVYIHSASYERFGVFGALARMGFFLSIIVITILGVIWRLGFDTNVNRFISVNFAASGMELVVLILATFKLMESTWKVSFRPRSKNFRETLPVVLGNMLGISVTIANFPIIGFSETPLGRFLTTLQVYVYLIDLIISDERRPVRDSFSFGRSATPGNEKQTRFDLPSEKDAKPVIMDPNGEISRNDTITTRTLSPVTEKSEYEDMVTPYRSGPTIRRSSRVPSWLVPRGTMTTETTGGRSSDEIGLQSDASMPAQADIYNELSLTPAPAPPAPIREPEPAAGAATNYGTAISTGSRTFSNATSRGMGSTIIFAAPSERTASSIYPSTLPPARNQQDQSSTQPPVPPVPKTKPRPSSISSNAVYSKAGIRLSSPNIDANFMTATPIDPQPPIVPQNNSKQVTISREPSAEALTPRVTNATAVSVPPPPPVPAHHTLQPPPDQQRYSDSRGSSGRSGQSRYSEVSIDPSLVTPSNGSHFSLSNFPDPPEGRNSSLSLPRSTMTGGNDEFRTGSMPKSLMIEDETFTFDPPSVLSSLDKRRSSGASSGDSARRPRDITSFIGGLSANPKGGSRDTEASGLRRELALSPLPESESSVFSPPITPISDAVIQQAQVIDRAPSAGTNSSISLPASAPIDEPSNQNQRSPPFSGRRSPPTKNSTGLTNLPPGVVGLPSTPRVTRKGSTSSNSSASSTATAMATAGVANSMTGQSTARTSPSVYTSTNLSREPSKASIGYDPKRPFERPRPAPALGLIKEQENDQTPSSSFPSQRNNGRPIAPVPNNPGSIRKKPGGNLNLKGSKERIVVVRDAEMQLF